MHLSDLLFDVSASSVFLKYTFKIGSTLGSTLYELTEYNNFSQGGQKNWDEAQPLFVSFAQFSKSDW